MKIELEADIPEGYEATGEFRMPKRDDWFLNNQHRALQATGDYNEKEYIILRKKKRKVIVFVPDAAGDYCQERLASWLLCNKGDCSRPRYRREEREED